MLLVHTCHIQNPKSLSHLNQTPFPRKVYYKGINNCTITVKVAKLYKKKKVKKLKSLWSIQDMNSSGDWETSLFIQHQCLTSQRPIGHSTR